MKSKYLIVNKKKLISLFLSFGISLSSSSLAEVISYNQKGYLKNGKQINVYFTTGNSDTDYAYVSYDNLIGFIPKRDINFNSLSANSDFHEETDKYIVINDNINVYLEPNTSSIVQTILKKGDIVNAVAKSNNGWFIITKDDMITGFIEEYNITKKDKEILVAKITGNNVNVRLSPSTSNKNNIIGFADITDLFQILGKKGDWYIIDYLGQTGYIHGKYVREMFIKEKDFKVKKIAYLKNDTAFYKDTNRYFLSYLPKYQNVFILGEENGLYRIMVDGCFGYIEKNTVNDLTNTFALVDLARQLVRVYENNREIYRAHMINGRMEMSTEVGCFKIGHRIRGYQLTPENYVEFWLQYNHNIGFHDASWQDHQNYIKVAEKAYELFAKGKATIYPFKYGSHGCNNLEYYDAANLFDILRVGNNVLVIGPNYLVNDHVLSDRYLLYQLADYLLEDEIDSIKVKKLV